jgi:hypothetical protein
MNPHAQSLVKDDDPAIVLVSTLPDFASLYSESELTPRSAAKLWFAATSLHAFFADGLGDEIIAELPPLARRHADERFVSAFAYRFAIIGKRIASGLPWLESIATCTADEMAVHLILPMVDDFDELADPTWIEQFPAHEDDDQIECLDDLLLQDTDVLMLYNPALDGIEDSDSPVNQQLGVANLHPKDWFKPFANVE